MALTWPTILTMEARPSDPMRALRHAVNRLPGHTKEAMLRGIDSNRIIVGAYVDPRSGGICPMLAAHRNGGRTDVASFARAWDAYTDARRPRRATRREVRTLRTLIVDSLEMDPVIDQLSITELAAQLRAEREAFRCAEAAERRAGADVPTAPNEDEPRAPEPLAEPLVEPDLSAGSIHVRRSRKAWLGSMRRGQLKDLLTAVEEQLDAKDPTPADGERAPSAR